MTDRVGQQFGNYRLTGPLGQGSFAEVYLGQHVRLELQAAIKLLHTHLTVNEAEQFYQEAQTLAKLVHPAIVNVFDYDVQEGVPFLVMEFAPGGSLRQRYPKGSVVLLDQILASVQQVAAALQYAHERQVIHRDVKPENMLVGRHQQVLLSDFGLATLAHSTASEVAQGNVGTIAYMAPEQIEGHPRAASDQYSLSIVVYEWLCGARPFQGTLSEVLVQHLSLPPPPLRERVPTVPVEVEQVVLKALTKDPKQRFASVQDFALALHVASTAATSTGSTQFMLASGYVAEARQTTKHNLPSHLTTLIGRKHEIAAACTLLRRPDVRLLTFTGTGGVGKTRLALEVARELVHEFADGVHLVSLAPLSDPAFVIPTIAHSMGLTESGSQPLLERLKTSQRDKQRLLLLDNFEQVITAAPLLAELWEDCPGIKLLVTSREVLRLRAEHQFTVPPLALPDSKRLPDDRSLAHFPAVNLFIQRAQAIKSDFQVTADNAATIAEICLRLDGLPLAIELAAARVKVLSLQALLARLDRRLHVLTGGARDLPERQRTLRNTLAWSYELLTAQEQRLFRGLSVFSGGCTLEAIEAVCAALDDEADHVLEGVASLLDKCLLHQTEQERAEPRFVMLETIREYGLEALVASGEEETTRRAHATYYLALADEAAKEISGTQQAARVQRLERERDNMRAALQWSLEQGEAGEGMEMALRFSRALADIWIISGRYSEGRTFLKRVLAGSKGNKTSLRAEALNIAAGLAVDQGDFGEAEELSEESLALSRRLEDARGSAASLSLQSNVAWAKDTPIAASSLLEEALTLYRELDDKKGIAQSLYNLGWQAKFRTKYTRARVLLEQALAIQRELGDTMGIARTLHELADTLFRDQGDSVTVRSRLEESRALFAEVGDKEGTAWVLETLGKLAHTQGDTTIARSRLEDALALYKEIGDQPAMVYLLLDWASRVQARGEFVWAAQLLANGETMRESIGLLLSSVERIIYEQAVATLRAQLGEKGFVSAWAEGQAMTPEQVLAAQGSVTIPTLPTKPVTTSLNGLTAHEVEVLRLLAQGLTNAQIAEQLIISPRTVNNHLTSIYSKIQVSSRSAATRYAIEHELAE
jgi:predicted ATPase/serine/threonine protein kinase/DNA-binding CsgD family transcriptional regulator